MDLKKGMFVRTTINKIGKIDDVESWNLLSDKISRASFQIKDILKIGDYANGLPIIKIDDDYIYIGKIENSVPLLYEEIKSIVTKEQFENISYKIN